MAHVARNPARVLFCPLSLTAFISVLAQLLAPTPLKRPALFCKLLLLLLLLWLGAHDGSFCGFRLGTAGTAGSTLGDVKEWCQHEETFFQAGT